MKRNSLYEWLKFGLDNIKYSNILEIEIKKEIQKQINRIIEQLNDLKEDALSGLTSEETKLLRMRFGLYNGKMMTCKEISEFIDLSETQIRTRIDNAINNLQYLVYVNVGDYINRIFFMLPIKSALPAG